MFDDEFDKPRLDARKCEAAAKAAARPLSPCPPESGDRRAEMGEGITAMTTPPFPQTRRLDHVRVYQKPEEEKIGTESISKDLCPPQSGC
jgi:hypothetical protein